MMQIIDNNNSFNGIFNIKKSKKQVSCPKRTEYFWIGYDKKNKIKESGVCFSEKECKEKEKEKDFHKVEISTLDYYMEFY